jgi:tRNA(Ile2) C34 agmatinyltransferase TiaS
MIVQNMSLFKKYDLKLNPEVTPGVCPHCNEMSSFVSIVNDYYKCITCGTDVEQKINGVIKYLPIGTDKLIEKDNGST